MCFRCHFENWLLADKGSHVLAVIFDTYSFTAGPVDDNRWCRGDFHSPNSQIHIIVFIDGVIVVWLVRVYLYWLALENSLKAVSGCSPLWAVGRAYTDD